jgi:hypothetical protein
MRQTSEKIYDNAYLIQIVEEITALICGYPEYYEDEEKTLDVLSKLTSGGGFLTVFLDWVMEQDHVNVSNFGETAEALYAFCEQWREELQ